MKWYFLSLVLGLLLVTASVHAQYDEAPNALSIRGMYSNFVYVPTGDFNFDEGTGQVEIEYTRHIAPFLNIGIPLRVGKARFLVDEENRTTQDLSMVNMDALVQIKCCSDDQFFYPYIFGGVGAQLEDFDRFNVSAPVGVGLNFRLAKHLYFDAKGEYRFGDEERIDRDRDALSFGGGLRVVLGPVEEEVVDADADGIPDDEDLCPTVAGIMALSGCPDADGDGIADAQDDCPLAAGLEAFNGCPDTDGDGIKDSEDDCPETAGLPERNGCPILDADDDGINDEDDECPSQPGPASTNGCPDRDGDGIADKDDDCPTEYGPAERNGCPLKDRDGDGIADADDKCPDQAAPGTVDGCPAITREVEERLDFVASAVKFETSSDRLRADAIPKMDEIAEILKQYRTYNCKIEGHTDSQGSATFNQQLSEKRAKSCYDYLVAKGISPSRLSYEGFGESRPVADNRYADGREQNRRVEFELYRDND